MTNDDKLKSFAIELFKINAFKFGEFKTKVGIITPFYCDLRVIISYPELMKTLADLLEELLKNVKHPKLLCGVPYTAIPIATALSLKTGLPMLMKRQMAKNYGTKKLIEGVFKTGDKCIIVEDVVTSGSSILETVNVLQNEGLKCTDAVLLLNREQGGIELLKKHGINVHSVLTLTQLIDFLVDGKCIDNDTRKMVKEYVQNNQVSDSQLTKSLPINRLKMRYETRADEAKNPVAVKLFNIISTKQTNLCLAVDLTESTEILNLAEQLGPYICILKTHIDIIEDFHPNFLQPLKDIAKRHNFLLLEDRKFADIGKTVELQYSKGMFKISSWADLVTAHSITGKGVLDAIKIASVGQERGVFLLAETSASDSLISQSYTENTLKLAADYPDIVVGIVGQNSLFLDSPGLLQLTPGVKIDEQNDALGQKYNSPEFVVQHKGADIAVVGRGITNAKDSVAAAKEYKNLLWQAYLQRVIK